MKSNAAVRRRWDVSEAYDQWRKSNKTEKEIAKIARGLNVTETTAFLLYSRGCETLQAARAFLNPDSIAFRDPYSLPDMDIAVERILEAIDRGDKIAIYGDYDVDGVTSVAVLYLYLTSLGASVQYYIPCRSGEGYGVSENAIKSLCDDGVKLIITVDTGITACCEVDYAKSLGVEMIITDHHECHCALPKASAVINDRRPDSRYPFREFAGVGVVFKLVTAIEMRLKGNPDVTEAVCEKYADLIAIGTVADVMPLTDENRRIVAIGLKNIEKNPRPGIKALLEKAGAADNRRVNAMLIGFVIAPRINAAGRIANAAKAVELLLTDSQSKANAIALELCETNCERQREEHKIVHEAKEKIEKEFDFAHDKVIVLADDSWHHGVIGIVASRITERYNRPSILISFEGNDKSGEDGISDTDIGKGSGRSVHGLNLVETLSDCSDLLLKFGGHELAAGLSIERGKLDEFRRAVNAFAAERLSDEDLITTINIDACLTSSDLSMRQAEELRLLEPCGVSNLTPVFALTDAKVTELVPIGNNKHSRLTFKCGEVQCGAVYFGRPPSSLNIYAGDMVDIVFNLDVNEFNGSKTVQLILRDIRVCENERNIIAAERERYLVLRDGVLPDGIDDPIKYLPNRDNFAAVYLFIKRECGRGENDIFIRAIDSETGGKLGYVKIRFIIDILNETNILSAEQINPDTDLFAFKIYPTCAKVCLEKSCLFKKLKKTLCTNK